MRRLSGVVLAGALLILPAFSLTGHAQEAAKPAPTTYNADAVIVMYAVNPGKEADYEQVIAKLKDALGKSTVPEAKQQLAGWKVVKSQKPLSADGPTYIHIISPVVRNADYSIVNIVYSVSTDDEKRDFYNLYKGALKGALSQILADNMGAASAAPTTGAGAGAPGAQ
jgi:hypothetical protein